jgi:DMSO/TMAO reductase YedYZ molybdopterin-dependent catalytic subunit
MSNAILLRVDGEVQRPLSLTFDDLAAIPERVDVSHHVPGRTGEAVLLDAILILAGAKPSAVYLTLHSGRDDFHASIPLMAVRDRAMVVFRRDGKPLPAEQDGPLRFLIPDCSNCHTSEIDECANVKHVDHIELGAVRGRDNRPSDEAEHAQLHQQQGH